VVGLAIEILGRFNVLFCGFSRFTKATGKDVKRPVQYPPLQNHALNGVAICAWRRIAVNKLKAIKESSAAARLSIQIRLRA
jgi:hypothetical protein